MSTFSKKLLIVIGVIEVIIFLGCLIVFPEIFPVILILGLFFFGGVAGLLKLMEWLSE